MIAPLFVRPRRSRGRGIAAVGGAYVVLALWLGWDGARAFEESLGIPTSRMSASGMISLLSAVASGMIAFTGVVFSLAFVGLQFGSSTYGPRAYGALGGGQPLAHAVGIFTGTFVFALMAIRTIDVGGTGSVPQSIAWMSLAWLLASVAMAILLLPRVTQMSIGRVLAELGERGREAAARVYRSPHDGARVGREHREGEPATRLSDRRIVVHRGAPAYLVGFDVAWLIEEARRARGLVEIPRPIGAIVEPGEPLAIVHAAAMAVSDRRIRRAVWLGLERKTDNDPAYALRLLVDTAIRALSPGINDPTTAVDALDRIQAVLAAIGHSRLDIGHLPDRDGVARLVFPTPTWCQIVELGLSEIAQYGRDSTQVRARLRVLADSLAARLDPSRHAALARTVGDVRPPRPSAP